MTSAPTNSGMLQQRLGATRMQQKSSDDSSILIGSGHPVAVSGDEGCAAPGAVKAGAKERNGGIDALRAAVTLLVVFHHTAITYGLLQGNRTVQIHSGTVADPVLHGQPGLVHGPVFSVVGLLHARLP